MRTFVVGIFITIAIAAMPQDRRIEPRTSDFPARDFSSLQPFVKGMAMATRDVAGYIVRAASLPSHRHSNPALIVWTKEAVVTEQRDGEAAANRNVGIGQIDVYPAGTIHSLRAITGSLHFTLIELKHGGANANSSPNKTADCNNTVTLPQGGFACLMRIPPNGQITIPKLDVNSLVIALDSGRVRQSMAANRWETHYREGQIASLPGYEQRVTQNLENKPLQIVLVVPASAE